VIALLLAGKELPLGVQGLPCLLAGKELPCLLAGKELPCL
jgi:hypothetical protein